MAELLSLTPGYFSSIAQELSHRERVFEDDVSFLREVKEGRAAATPDMDPEYELEFLKLRFQRFQTGFKVGWSPIVACRHQMLEEVFDTSLPAIALYLGLQALQERLDQASAVYQAKQLPLHGGSPRHGQGAAKSLCYSSSTR